MIVRAREVRKSFKSGADDLEILKGVSLEIPEPTTLSIMGRSGCGKSTFISLLAGLDSATGGTIEILGQNLDALKARGLNAFRARHIGIIFQQFHLLDHLNALENVRLPLDLNKIADGDEKAKAMLERVGLSHRMTASPDTLSRGEQQRVAIARVLVMKPELLLADEPTGSLDLKTGASIVELLFQLAETEKIALVMATHDANLARRCARQMTMEDGRLREGLLV